MTLNIGIIGATGIIGRHLAMHLRNHPALQLSLYASPQSRTRSITIDEQSLTVFPINSKNFNALNGAIFATSKEISQEYVPQALHHDCRVIDLSAAFRLNPDIPLFCAGVNEINRKTPLIACPNCTTSLIAKVIAPLHKQFPVEGFSVCTYQSISGAGWHAVQTWKQQLEKTPDDRPIVPLAHNCIPWIDFIDDSPHTGEELAVILESKKLLQQPDLKISATCVRVSCKRSHGIALTIQFQKKTSVEAVQECLGKIPYLSYALKTPIECTGESQIYYSRLREVEFPQNAISLWITGDQITAGTIANVDGILEKWS